MGNRITIEFPSVEMLEYFIGQMSDGFGENFCGFSTTRKKHNTIGNKLEDYEKITDKEGNLVCFVDFVEGFDNLEDE